VECNLLMRLLSQVRVRLLIVLLGFSLLSSCLEILLWM
jgi:hypothetical protein